MNCYVYILLDHHGRPFYVGKGSRNRWMHHEKIAATSDQSVKSRIIRSMWRHGWRDIPKVKVREGLSHQEAYAIEVALIAAIGRRPDGLLVNRTRGGDGLIDPSSETRKKISVAHRGRKNGPMPEETKRKISAANSGKKRTPEQCARVSAALKGYKRSEAFKTKISATMKGRPSNNPNGPGLASRAKMSASRKGKTLSSETREKIRQLKLHMSKETRDKLREAALRQWARKRAQSELIFITDAE